jgi:hypothetical protein
VRALERAVLQVRLGETTHGIGECLLFFVEFEIHLPGAPAEMSPLFPSRGFDRQLQIGYRVITFCNVKNASQA